MTELHVGTGDVVVTLDLKGRLTGVRVGGDARNLAATDPQPLLELVVGGQTLFPEDARTVAGGLEIGFDGGAASVRLAIEQAPGRLVFRVEDVQPGHAESLRMRLALLRLDEVDPALNGTYDDATILCLRSIEARTRCIYRSLTAGVPQPGVEWDAGHGMVGGAAALLATPRADFYSSVHALQDAFGLPSPRFDGTAARASPTARESYLFLTYLQPGDVPKITAYANLAGLKRVLILRDLWRTSSGTYALEPSRWPGGAAGVPGLLQRVACGRAGRGPALLRSFDLAQ